MLPTFVIGLREGLEAALIVGIVAASLGKQGRRDLLRWVVVGVATAVLLCIAVGIALDLLAQELPQRQQEGLETVVGALAVGMVTYMVVWMRRHSRDLKGDLESAAAAAIGSHSATGRAMVLMAFLAVLREGFETVIFLLAAFNETGSRALPVAGAVAGIVLAVGLGYGLYRGGIRLNLSRFFRATGLVLVLVAAGLVMTALGTAHEAGWLDSGQTQLFDLTWLVRPGSVQSSLLTGVLGLPSRPVLIQVVGWLLYLVPVALYVAWPPGRGPSRRAWSVAAVTGGALAGIAAISLLVTAPATRTSTAAGGPAGSERLAAIDATSARLQPAGETGTSIPLHVAGTESRDGVLLRRYVGTSGSARETSRVTVAQLAGLNGGRLPLGVEAGEQTLRLARSSTTRWTALISATGDRLVDVTSRTTTSGAVDAVFGVVALGHPLATAVRSLPAGAVNRALDAARADQAAGNRRRLQLDGAWGAAALGLALIAAIQVGRRLQKPG